MTACPKCGKSRKPSDIECPHCGLIYEKYGKKPQEKKSPINYTIKPPLVAYILVLIGGVSFIGGIIGAYNSPSEFDLIWIMAGIIQLAIFYAFAKIITYLKGIHENTATLKQ